MTSDHDEDEILNIPDDDDETKWNEFDDLDEEGILGDDAYSNNAVKPEEEVDYLGASSAEEETVALQPVNETDPDDVLDYNEDEEENVKTPVEDEVDDESDNEESARDKFRSERAVTSTAPSSRAIPDSLDDVKVKPETFASFRNGRGGGRGGRPPGQQKVLINPRYRGSVPQQPNIRLRWDTSQMPMIQMGAVRVVPSRPIIPTASNMGLLQMQRFGMGNNQRPGMFAGPPPSFGNAPMPLMSMPTVVPVRLYPQSSAPFMTSMPPPSNIHPPPLSNAFSQPPPRMGGGGGVVVRPQQTDLSAYSRLGPTSSAAPHPSLTGAFAGNAPNDGSWDRMVEDFVKRNSRQRPTTDHRPSREDRSRSPPPRRRVRSKSPDDSQRPSSTPHDRDLRRRLATDQPFRGELKTEKTKSAVQNVDVESARAIGLDDEYLKKMEDQKRLREAMVRRKEQRRIQEVKKKQDEQSVPATQGGSAIVNKAAADFAVVPQQQRAAPSHAKKTMNQRKGPTPSDSTKETSSVRQVILPVTLPSHKMSAVISEASKPILRTIVNQKVKPGGSEAKVERRAVAAQSVPTPPALRIPIGKKGTLANASKEETAGESGAPARISIHERFSSSQFKQQQREPVKEVPAPKKVKKAAVSIAAVVRDISGWDGALGRLTLVAGTVGNVKKCWKSASDAVSIIFEDQDKAINFQQQYNSKVMSGMKLSVKLEPVSDLDS